MSTCRSISCDCRASQQFLGGAKAPRRVLKNPLSEFPVGRKTRNRRLFAGRVPNCGFYDGISGERDRLCFANRGFFRPLLERIAETPGRAAVLKEPRQTWGHGLGV